MTTRFNAPTAAMSDSGATRCLATRVEDQRVGRVVVLPGQHLGPLARGTIRIRPGAGFVERLNDRHLHATDPALTEYQREPDAHVRAAAEADAEWIDAARRDAPRIELVRVGAVHEAVAVDEPLHDRDVLARVDLATRPQRDVL